MACLQERDCCQRGGRVEMFLTDGSSTFSTMGHGFDTRLSQKLFLVLGCVFIESNSHIHHPVLSVADNILVYFLSPFVL